MSCLKGQEMEKLPSVYFDNQIQKNWADQVTEMKKFRTTQHPELFYILSGDADIPCFGLLDEE